MISSYFSRSRKMASLAAFVALFAIGGSASAATCTAINPLTDPDASVTNSTSCGLGNASNSDSAADVNAVEPSALSWSLIDKSDDNSGSGLLMSGQGTAGGTWGIDTAGLTSNTFLIVIKDGNANGGSTWAWFIIDTSLGCAATGNYFAAAEYCGDWTMYENKAISHMSLYGTTTASTGTPSGSTGTPSGSTGNVPEPGSSALALLGLGLLGVGFGLRKKSLRG